MVKQAHIYYSGKVQGVGFRYIVKDLAEGFRITGWVKNLQDGRVEILAELEEDILKDFLKKIRGNFSGYIRDVEIDWKPATGEFSEFAIKF